MLTLLYLVLVAISGYFLLSPFFQRQVGLASAFSSNGHDELDHEKHLLLNELREIDLDFQMGKLSRQDYDKLSHEYKLRTAQVLHQLKEKKDKTVETTPDEYCSECGAIRLSGARFCPSCGHRLEGADNEN